MRSKVTLNIGLNNRDNGVNNESAIVTMLGDMFCGLIAWETIEGEYNGDKELTVVAVVIVDDVDNGLWLKTLQHYCDLWRQECIAWAVVDHKGRIAEGGLEWASDVTPYLSFSDEFFTTHYRGFAS